VGALDLDWLERGIIEDEILALGNSVSDTTNLCCLTGRELAMGLIELIVTVCAVSLPSQCEDQHFLFSAGMSLNQCVMNAQPYIAQWINEHPKWVAVRRRCGYGGSKEKI
jgi:hypothetical protein